VITRTLDSAGYDEKGVQRFTASGNPLIGPFYVEGAQPGDALRVRLEKLHLNRNYGYTSYRLELVALMPEYIEHVFPAEYKADVIVPGRSKSVPWDIDLEHNRVRLREPKSRALQFDFEAQPMLGCIGVAPAGDFAPTSKVSGVYGGNLDFNRIVEGATVILPVYHPGALLYVGDGHALQADGEPTGNGIETTLDLEFTVELRKAARVSGPRVELPDAIFSLGSQPEFSSSLDTALRMATTDMIQWLTNDYGLEPWAAHVLIGFQGRFRVVTVMGSMALEIPRKHLPAPK
jgi:acetamidase/formamidase